MTMRGKVPAGRVLLTSFRRVYVASHVPAASREGEAGRDMRKGWEIVAELSIVVLVRDA